MRRDVTDNGYTMMVDAGDRLERQLARKRRNAKIGRARRKRGVYLRVAA